ncbi:MAG: molybdopterin-guanine dinucleotide biosynthesis protein B [Gammaproteobacteria bacterium]|nr:MAG: molybdopterin-guanine dinucleotide biosynthesis protein B [Gammaproteobacteria bacterium]
MLPQSSKHLLSEPLSSALNFAVLGFAARSGTGKTTLLKQLIPVLKARQLRLGLIKHTHHRITFDNAGITRRVFAGGVNVIATSPQLSMAEYHVTNAQDALSEGITGYQHLPIDLLLIEGFKAAAFPKIELHRHSLNQPLLCLDDQHIVAVASDVSTLDLPRQLPLLPLNNPAAIAAWIVQNICRSI